MKLKKYLSALFFLIACLCVGFAFGCKDDNVPEYTVDFVASEHVSYVVGDEKFPSGQKKFIKDSVLEFSVALDYGYENPVVKENGNTLVAADGKYSVVVTENVEITVSVSEDELAGNGTSAAPYLVSTLKDLKTVADMVNSGYRSYVLGYYKLTNDIDCGGEKLDAIGNFETQSSFFAGNFDGDNHTVSNYVMETNDKTYIGFFGCVQASTSTDTGIIKNLNVKDFTITATAAEGRFVSVGSIVSYAVGASIVNCSATDGNIYLYGNAYFSYAGGAVGAQQSATLTGADGRPIHYLCTTEYVHTDVYISATGYVMAGGVVGHSVSSHERAPSMIINSYAEGTVYGAMRAGGVVGWLDNYASVANSYSTSYVFAAVNFPVAVTDPEYFAYAGGIAGYAGEGTVVTDSFTTSIVDAVAVNASSQTGDVFGYGVSSTDVLQGASYDNCYWGNGVNATNAEFVKNTLFWKDTDWKIVNGSLPVTDFKDGSNDFAVTLDYGDYKVNGVSSSSTSLKIQDNSYHPFSFYLGEELNEYVFADNEGSTENVSYGYFFDEECTRKVPFGYIPTRDITLYLGFADYSQVTGTYEFTKNGRTVQLILGVDKNSGVCAYTYVDTRAFSGMNYIYDGQKLTFADGYFARLSDIVAEENGVKQPWLNFSGYTFAGTASDGKISLYDGNYFTAASPLVFVKPDGTSVSANKFVGTWERSATLKETYTFTSDGKWTYKWKNTTKNGAYSVDGGVATLTGDLNVMATFNDAGLLSVDGKFYCLENSFFGLWYSPENGAYLRLNGYGSALSGDATVLVDGTTYNDLMYVKDGFFEVLTGNPYTYTLLSGYALFGYFEYDADAKSVTAMLYDEGAADFIEFNLLLVDDYNGEWIGEDSIGGVKFELADFNGLGIYKTEIENEPRGYVIINGDKVSYECSVENGMEGTFEYGGVTYKIIVNGDGTVTVTNGTANANLYRKDEMYSLPLVYGGSYDTEGKIIYDEDSSAIYEFDGGGRLTNGGVLTVTAKDGAITEYRYKIASGSVDIMSETLVADIVINLYSGSVDAAPVGTITVDGYKFVFKLNGERGDVLDLYLTFADRDWAISSIMNPFYIGRFDLSLEATGSFNGVQNITFDYYPEHNYIEIYHIDMFDSDNSFHVYLLLLSDGNLAVSSYPYLVSGDYSYASLCDDIYGTWINTKGDYTIEFDGLADSMYTTGVAFDGVHGLTYLYTRRFGKIYMWLINDESTAYIVEHLYDDTDGELIFRKTNSYTWNRLQLTQTDVLGGPIFTATDGSGVKYGFNFDGTIDIGDESGTYLLRKVSGDKTTVVINVSGEEFVAEVDHVNGTLTRVAE